MGLLQLHPGRHEVRPQYNRTNSGEKQDTPCPERRGQTSLISPLVQQTLTMDLALRVQPRSGSDVTGEKTPDSQFLHLVLRVTQEELFWVASPAQALHSPNHVKGASKVGQTPRSAASFKWVSSWDSGRSGDSPTTAVGRGRAYLPPFLTLLQKQLSKQPDNARLLGRGPWSHEIRTWGPGGWTSHRACTAEPPRETSCPAPPPFPGRPATPSRPLLGFWKDRSPLLSVSAKVFTWTASSARNALLSASTRQATAKARPLGNVGGTLWIQSILTRGQGVWLRDRAPAWAPGSSPDTERFFFHLHTHTHTHTHSNNPGARIWVQNSPAQRAPPCGLPPQMLS
ncbi:uncharacterized protein LOC125358841 isoform X2 [Perognathus longimembris pacificus]|uniref:uncharacterized protein LOC125358841 isoform X2 n=1 Tax=Perognathus longimembris pacificus TaxID=214514 RepID=UPI0020199DFA|nr:uncharacterized protein LOC125358841 isoform X2 [Perognathus longimembris pacificus]